MVDTRQAGVAGLGTTASTAMPPQARTLTLPSGRDRAPHTYQRGCLTDAQLDALEALARGPDFAFSAGHGEDTLTSRPGPVTLPYCDHEGRVHVVRIARNGRILAHARSSAGRHRNDADGG